MTFLPTEPEVRITTHTPELDVLKEYLQTEYGLDWGTAGEVSPGEWLIAFAGKLCYRSFAPDLNPNVAKVRENLFEYIGNLLKQGHESVLEHLTVSCLIRCSRLVTHELVRHRVGASVSQESLRFVRLEDLPGWVPGAFRESEPAKDFFAEMFELLSESQCALAEELDVDSKPMAEKKKLTSAMRRLAPMGLSTTILWTPNLRTARHVILQRTSRHAEEEIRLIFDKIATRLSALFPAVFQDFKREEVDGCGEWTKQP